MPRQMTSCAGAGMGLSGVTASMGKAGMPAMASDSPARTCGVRKGMASDRVS